MPTVADRPWTVYIFGRSILSILMCGRTRSDASGDHSGAWGERQDGVVAIVVAEDLSQSALCIGELLEPREGHAC